MRFATLTILVAALALALVLVGCQSQAAHKDKELMTPVEIVQDSLNAAQTIGNHSFLPLFREGEPSGIAEEILTIMTEFEKRHPEREKFVWRIDSRHASFDYHAWTYGLWVDHERKPNWIDPNPMTAAQ
jgi:hypothetical protein